jgi:hypothetical protein
MSRYKIAIQLQNIPVERKAYRFPSTNFVARTIQFIQYCIKEGVIYIADNIPQDALDAAVISVSKSCDIPVVVESESKAMLFSISHSQKIYSLENLPRNRYVLCYNCSDYKLSPGMKALVVVYGHTGDMEFL